jgi:hypothetical protein
MAHTQSRPQRTAYQTALVRPDSLVSNRDVAMIDGQWREVFDTYTYANVAELLEMHAHDRETTTWIKRHLAEDTDELYVIVRFLVEVPGGAELNTQIKVYRRCELIPVQDPTPGDDDDPIAEVLGALHAEVSGGGQVEVLEELSLSAGLVWTCRAEACNGASNSTNRDTCYACGAPRPGA